MNLKANYGYVLLEVIKNNNMSDGGIALPENAIKPSNKGLVVSANEDDEDLEGATVYFKPYVGHTIVTKKKELLAVLVEDILAVEQDD